MRRHLLVAFLLVLAACSAEPELAPTTSAGSGATTTTVPETTTSTETVGSTTSTEPTTTTILPELQSLAYEEVASIDFPIHLVPWTESASLLATKEGAVHLFDGSAVSDAVLDISEEVHNEGERGLLAIAVHPDDPSRLFIHYSANGGDTTVEEYRIAADGSVDPEPVQLLLTVDQPAGNHNGGMIQFGPDGALYLGLGDGGGSNDRYGNGQNTDTLLGGLVRIDVDTADSELFQYGLRNPWRFWIDGDTIFVADVGQNTFEEVSVVPLQAEVNHGWPITEALHCFSPSSGCDTVGITLPVIEVRHGDAGTCSITGGVVYRGSAIPEVDGHFFYSDYCGGYLRSFRHDDGEAVDQTDWTDQVGGAGNVASFGLGHDGEMYVLTTSSVLRVTAVR